MCTPYLNGNCISETLSEGHIYMWMILLEPLVVNPKWDLSLSIMVLWHRGDFLHGKWYLLSVLMWMMQSLSALWRKSGRIGQQLFKWDDDPQHNVKIVFFWEVKGEKKTGFVGHNWQIKCANNSKISFFFRFGLETCLIQSFFFTVVELCFGF